MKRTPFAFLLFSLCVLACPVKAADAKPNVIFLLADDFATSGVGYTGDKDGITPNIDRLAHDGVRFMNLYDTTSICMASCCPMMTGPYECRHGCNFLHGDLERRFVEKSYPVILRQAGYIASGFPVEFGACSGDEAETVPGGEVKAADGGRVLRFVQAEREATLSDSNATSCDVYQLVDLRSLKSAATGGEATLELSVQFLDAREEKGEPVRFTGGLYVFSGTPDSLMAEWQVSRRDALAAGSVSCNSSGGASQNWQPVTAKVLLSAEADFAVVHLRAHNRAARRGNAIQATFGKQFADDVRLTLKTQPTLPVRLAQRWSSTHVGAITSRLIYPTSPLLRSNGVVECWNAELHHSTTP